MTVPSMETYLWRTAWGLDDLELPAKMMVSRCDSQHVDAAQVVDSLGAVESKKERAFALPAPYL